MKGVRSEGLLTPFLFLRPQQLQVAPGAYQIWIEPQCLLEFRNRFGGSSRGRKRAAKVVVPLWRLGHEREACAKGVDRFLKAVHVRPGANPM